MANAKYEILEGDKYQIKLAVGGTLKRIRALRDIPEAQVKFGDLGGYVQHEHNLSTTGSCWVHDDAKVFGHAEVRGDARLFGDARVQGFAALTDHVLVNGDAIIAGCTQLTDGLHISDDARIFSNAHVGWFANVGSEYGTLVWWRGKSCIMVRRGCFFGTLDAFEAAVKERHGDYPFGREYQCLIEVIRSRASAFTWEDNVND